MRPMGTAAYGGKGQGKGKGRGEGRLGHGGRGRSKGGEKPMGTTAYGGKGSKGRAANGDRRSAPPAADENITPWGHAKPPPPSRCEDSHTGSCHRLAPRASLVRKPHGTPDGTLPTSFALESSLQTLRSWQWLNAKPVSSGRGTEARGAGGHCEWVCGKLSQKIFKQIVY